MILVQDYLNKGGTLETLATDYAIKATRGKIMPHLVSLKYDQINSPMTDPLVQECRGIVLDESDNWNCVARGFDKFFNYGEPRAAEIDWSTAYVQEKVDGSLCMLYFYQGKWRVATSGTPDASGQVGGGWSGDYASLFWHTWSNMSYSTLWLDAEATYIFELTTPHNRVVVPHTKYKLTLLAIRRPSGEYGKWAKYGFDIVRSFPLTNIESILESFGTINALEQEGYVVVDAQNRRVKVKHPQYVALHHLKDGASPKNFVDVIRRGEVPELISSLPDLAAEFNDYQARYDSLCASIVADYDRLHNIETQKDFALEAKQTKCPAALFALRGGKADTVQSFFAAGSLDMLLRQLGGGGGRVMPIKPENRDRYPANWLTEIRPRILARAGNKCEECGVANYAYGARDKNGEWHDEMSIHCMNSDAGYLAFGDFPNMVKIVLTISRTDHDLKNNSDDNLRSLCQRCHLRHDAAQHAETRKATLARKRQEQAEQARAASPQMMMELA